MNGRLFNMYKLRSMYKDAEARKAELMKHNKMDGFMFKMDNDPRITKVGKVIRKFSIDELPQFFNVLKGDMSLVGTRPPTVKEFEQYESRHKRRLSMRPGITGMWQVSGRSNIEDFNMSFLSETPGQAEAVEYLKRVAADHDGPLRLMGHSKGGNLSVYAAVNSDKALQDRIEIIYSNDGPGFRDTMIEQKAYRELIGQILVVAVVGYAVLVAFQTVLEDVL